MLHRELLIDGHFVGGPCDQSVGKQALRSPWDGSLVGTAAEGGWSELRTAVASAHDAFPSWRRSTRGERRRLLAAIARSVRERSEELANLLVAEIGKPIALARAEVARTALTFDLAAESAEAHGPEDLPLGPDPRAEGVRCRVERVPLGVVMASVPFNFPLNLAAHKVGPALATGNTVVLKPSDKSPLSTLTLARLIHEAGCPPGVVNAWNGPPQVAQKGLLDERVRMLSFTGSEAVGWRLRSLVPDKRAVLELGGDAFAIVHRDADLDWAVERIVAGAFGFAGQVCIAVQHVLAHESIFEEFRVRLAQAVLACPVGDPAEARTVCGPVIDDDAADRVEGLVKDAVTLGATVSSGGGRDGRLIQPTLLEDVPPEARLRQEEAFGPVLTLARYASVEEACRQVNGSRYGIQAGVFVRDLETADAFYEGLDIGGVVLDDSPTLRFDAAPYGGVRRSGLGREGVRWAMDEMTDLKARFDRAQ